MFSAVTAKAPKSPRAHPAGPTTPEGRNSEVDRRQEFTISIPRQYGFNSNQMSYSESDRTKERANPPERHPPYHLRMRRNIYKTLWPENSGAGRISNTISAKPPGKNTPDMPDRSWIYIYINGAEYYRHGPPNGDKIMDREKWYIPS